MILNNFCIPSWQLLWHIRMNLSLMISSENSILYRFGKPLVIDMLEVDMFATVSDIFNRIQPELMHCILSKDIIENERWVLLKIAYLA